VIFSDIFVEKGVGVSACALLGIGVTCRMMLVFVSLQSATGHCKSSCCPVES